MRKNGTKQALNLNPGTRAALSEGACTPTYCKQPITIPSKVQFGGQVAELYALKTHVDYVAD